jgi:hypothetical protein
MNEHKWLDSLAANLNIYDRILKAERTPFIYNLKMVGN